MLKYLHQLTMLTVLLLIISAFTMCPAMAEHVTFTSSSVPSIDTSQAIRDVSIDEDDVFYVFTVDGQQGIVHERKIGDEEGLSRVEDVIIGDQCAALVSDTPEQTIVAITGGYLLTFDKNQKLITLSDSQSQGSNEEEALVIAVIEQIDDALVSVTQSDSDDDSWLSTIASLVPFSAQTIVKAGTLVCLTCVDPMLGAGYFVSTCLIGSANAIAFVVIPAVAVELGEVALKITAGVVIGAVVLETLKKMCKLEGEGYRYFAVEYIDENQNHHLYKFRYKGEEKGTAEYIGEVSFAEGLFTNLADAMITLGGNILKAGNDVITYLGNYIGIIPNDEKIQNNCPSVNPNLEDGKYYEKTGDFAATQSGNEISYTSALEIMTDCKDSKPPHGIFGTKKTCQEICEDANSKLESSLEVYPDEIHGEKLNGYYHHCHPYKGCHAHCWWY